MGPNKLAAALERVELVMMGGPSSTTQCLKKHVGVTVVVLRRKNSSNRETISHWYSCPTCAVGKEPFKLPQTTEEALNILEASGKLGRPTIWNAVFGTLDDVTGG